MDGDERDVEHDFPAVDRQRKVVLVDLENPSVGRPVMPVAAFEMDQIGFEQRLVQLLENVVAGSQRDLVFARITAGYKCYFIHFIQYYIQMANIVLFRVANSGKKMFF